MNQSKSAGRDDLVNTGNKNNTASNTPMINQPRQQTNRFYSDGRRQMMTRNMAYRRPTPVTSSPHNQSYPVQHPLPNQSNRSMSAHNYHQQQHRLNSSSVNQQRSGGNASATSANTMPIANSQKRDNNVSSTCPVKEEQNSQDSPDSSPYTTRAESKLTPAGRTRLFIGNIPNDMKEDELRELCSKYGTVVEMFVNSQRGFAFVRYDKRVTADCAKSEIDGMIIRGKVIRVRFASHGAAVRVKNISEYVSNELLADAFSCFGRVERAVVTVDDRGKPTGEGIVEFDRKPVALQCINKCSDNCFLLTSELKPVIVEALVQLDEEDGLMEKTLPKTDGYHKARSQAPRFVHPGSFEHSICVRWMELEEQRKLMEAQLKDRIELAREQLKIEIEQISIDHQSYMMREDLARRENELRFLEERRRHELEKKKNIIQQVIQQQQQQHGSFDFASQLCQFGSNFFANQPNMRMLSPIISATGGGANSEQTISALAAAAAGMPHPVSTPSQQQPHPLFNLPQLTQQHQPSNFQIPSLNASLSPNTGANNNNTGNLLATVASSSLAAISNAGLIPPSLLSSSGFFPNPRNLTLPAAPVSTANLSAAISKTEKSATTVTSAPPSTVSGPASVQQRGNLNENALSNKNTGSMAHRNALLDDPTTSYYDHQRKRSRF